MYEKFLLTLIYELSVQGTTVPWEAAAHRFSPGLTGDGARRAVNRLRRTLITEGHLVPPLHRGGAGGGTDTGTTGPADDSTVRGYVTTGDPTNDRAVRAVRFDERYKHPSLMPVRGGTAISLGGGGGGGDGGGMKQAPGWELVADHKYIEDDDLQEYDEWIEEHGGAAGEESISDAASRDAPARTTFGRATAQYDADGDVISTASGLTLTLPCKGPLVRV